MHLIRTERGATLLKVLVAGVIMAGAIIVYSQTQARLHRKIQSSHEKILALTFASELLEFLRSHQEDRLREYLSQNPFFPGVGSCPGEAACNPYPLCAHLNILDRENDVLINEEPLARLPRSILDGRDSRERANRWYQVFIVDMAADNGTNGEMQVRRDLCAQSAADIRFNGGVGGGIELSPTEKFQVTVGVTWVSRNSKQTERVVLTTIIPSQRGA